MTKTKKRTTLSSVLKAITPIDLLIFLFLSYVFYGIDYANMTMVNVVYLSAGIMWMVMLAVRLALVYRRERLK
ncbi:MAG: hypothetical protein IJ849_08420 [Selenomonadaceae bacterium]|nr:hypothetical protein [Selenomonadaceae bacterium]